MKKKDAIELLKDKFVEIDECEYIDACNNIGELKMFCKDGQVYFKPKAIFPIRFYSFDKTFKVYENGNIHIINIRENEETTFIFDNSLPNLYEAVALSKKQRGEQIDEE